jgi:hypothetical protein
MVFSGINMRKPIKFVFFYFIPLISTIVSLVALYLAYSANTITTRHNYSSVSPYLIIEMKHIPSKDSNEHVFGMYVKNVGLGPAIITGFEVYKDDKLLGGSSPTSGHLISDSFGFGKNALTKDDLRYGQIIPPGGSITITEVTKWYEALSPENFTEKVHKASYAHQFVVCYRSVYSEQSFAWIDPRRKVESTACASPNRFGTLPDPNRIQLAPPKENFSM